MSLPISRPGILIKTNAQAVFGIWETWKGVGQCVGKWGKVSHHENNKSM